MTAPEDVTITLTLGGRTYTSGLVELVQVSIGEARVIKKATGMTIADWRDMFRRVDREDPDLLIGMAYLMRTRAGETADWSDLDHMPVKDLVAAFDVTNEPDPAAAEAGPDSVAAAEVTPEPVSV